MNETSSALAAGQAAWLQKRAACLARIANRPPMPSVEVTSHPAAKERAKALGAWREVMRLGELLLGEAVQQLDELTRDPSALAGADAGDDGKEFAAGKAFLAQVVSRQSGLHSNASRPGPALTSEALARVGLRLRKYAKDSHWFFTPCVVELESVEPLEAQAPGSTVASLAALAKTWEVYVKRSSVTRYVEDVAARSRVKLEACRASHEPMLDADGNCTGTRFVLFLSLLVMPG